MSERRSNTRRSGSGAPPEIPPPTLPQITFLIDENAGPLVGGVLEKRGHRVLYVANVCPGFPDPAVKRYADERMAVIVTFNCRDFADIRRHGASKYEARYRHAARVSLHCVPAVASRRVDEVLHLIECEHEHRRNLIDKRLIVDVTADEIRIH